MPRFSRKTPPAPTPVRPHQVARLRAAIKAEDDAGMFGTLPDAPDGLRRDWERAKAALAAVERNSTAAEIAAANQD
jgi:hypothetical protein